MIFKVSTTRHITAGKYLKLFFIVILVLKSLWLGICNSCFKNHWLGILGFHLSGDSFHDYCDILSICPGDILKCQVMSIFESKSGLKKIKIEVNCN